MTTLLAVGATALLVSGCSGCAAQQGALTTETGTPDPPSGGEELATFAGGCFWCVESAFDDIPGVVSALSGYTGGPEVNPTYQQVASGATGHVEAVQITYDPARLSYEDLLWVFWRQIDPTDDGGQFVDRGTQYATAIFVHDADQRRLAEASRTELGSSGRYDEPIVTPIRDAGPFYVAEDYHQDFHETNPERYQSYRAGSGRDQYLAGVWGDEPHGSHAWADRPTEPGDGWERPSDEELRERLTDLQYRVTQEDATESPFDNEYWNNHDHGIYVDVVSGEPLFSSVHKYESGTGWPSFHTPLVSENVVEVEDRTYGMVRTEVRSRLADSHLGHLFSDGPQPTGLRYCINSASLRFITVAELENEGYAEYRELFD